MSVLNIARRLTQWCAQSRQSRETHAGHEAGCAALCCARRGETACVLRLNGSDATVARLRELGLREGATVEVVRDGDPLLIKVNGARFGLGRRCAMDILCRIHQD